MELRESSPQKLAKDLHRLAPKADKSWLRQVKLWRSGEEGALQRTNAELLGDALNANFQTFVRQYVESGKTSRAGDPKVHARLEVLEKALSELVREQKTMALEIGLLQERVQRLEVRPWPVAAQSVDS